MWNQAMIETCLSVEVSFILVDEKRQNLFLNTNNVGVGITQVGTTSFVIAIKTNIFHLRYDRKHVKIGAYQKTKQKNHKS